MDQNLSMTRGDTASFNLQFVNYDGDLENDMQSMIFTVKENVDSGIAVFQKTLGSGISKVNDSLYVVRIAPADTEDLGLGYYYYDLQIRINGDAFTVLKGVIEITYDVTTTEQTVIIAPYEELEDIRVGYDGRLYDTAGEAVRGQISDLHDEVDILDGRMDEFASLPEGSTAGNAELVDIRVGANGVTYPSAGDAVRGQVEELDDKIDENADAIGDIDTDVDVLKSRMDVFTSLEEGSTTGDAELQDIRVGANGTTYPTAGDAVRGQVEELYKDISDIGTHTANLFDKIKAKDGYTFYSNGSVGTLDTAYISDYIYIGDLDTFYIYPNTYAIGRLVFYNSKLDTDIASVVSSFTDVVDNSNHYPYVRFSDSLTNKDNRAIYANNYAYYIPYGYEKALADTEGELLEGISDEIDYTVLKDTYGAALAMSAYTTQAGNTTVRYSANPTEKAGYLDSLEIKCSGQGTSAMVYIGTFVNGIYKYVDSFSINSINSGTKTYKNGINFTYNKMIPQNAVFGLLGANINLYYVSGDISLNLLPTEAVIATGVSTSTLAYGIAIKCTLKESESIVSKMAEYVLPIKPTYNKIDISTLTNSTKTIDNNPPYAIKKNLALMFICDIQAFDFIRLRYINTVGNLAYDGITIDNTNVTVSNVNNSSVAVYPHGLTIQNNIAVLIKMNINETADITIMSDGEIFTKNISWFRMIDTVTPQIVASDNTSLTDCTMSIQSEDISKDVYIYGDSYFNYMPERWIYYAEQYGYTKNMQINGYPGGSSAKMLTCFNEDLKHGTPKYVLWALGMNDTSDVGTVPATDWLSAVQEVIAICEKIGAIPVLATIPTCATNGTVTRNNEGKNAWVRASGYNYIDFAKAVGADADGVWFDGMLEPTGGGITERVHPTIKGAKALFMQACVDFPEMMIDN